VKVLILIAMSISVFAWDKFYPSFHAKVVNVAKDDVLNIRLKPTYKSKKLGYLKVSENVQIEYCLDSSKSTWCKVYPTVSINIGVEKHASSGYVNARFLEFKNQGYINIKNRKSNCDYLIKCKNDKCLILGYEGLEWVKRSLIGVEKGQKMTSVSYDEEADGIEDDATFCFNHYRDQELWSIANKYIKKQK